MRFAAAVGPDHETLATLADGVALTTWDTETGAEDSLPNPARALVGGRRLAALDALLGQGAEVVCAAPLSFCTASYAIAQAMGLRFLPLEAGTPLRVVRAHAAALVAAARPDLPPAWLASPAPPGDEPAAGLTLSAGAVRALHNRLRRLEGQARGLQRMLDEGQSADQIMTQLAAMRAALNAIGLTLLAENLAGCLAAAQARDDATGHQAVEAAKRAFLRLN
ncbi:MAG TPA: metal-sensitive transcriptional regulator [Thermomicrobiales bacterium]|nr:metal-sensitive transcriptional regulator [Thermomicrobiales bacterium]